MSGRSGRVVEASGMSIVAALPDARVGDTVQIEGRAAQAAEVVAVSGCRAIVVPAVRMEGIAVGDSVRSTGRPLRVRCGDGLRGRLLDGLGVPMDGPALTDGSWVPVDREAPAPMARAPVTKALPVGVRAIDAFVTLGKGQRVGLFAAAGAGKSTLLDQMARGTEADVVVRCIVGERGREVRESVGDGVAANAVLVAATADDSALARRRAPFVATAVAEWFRDRGADVLLLVDSLTRLARAQRELGLAAGEPATRHGYPTSVFALLPRLLERAGPTRDGSITAIYTVLVAGDDPDEPIADETRGLLDGHIVLDRDIAAAGRWPPIDVVRSLSRVMNRVTTTEHRAAAARVRTGLAARDQNRDLLALGAYARGTDPDLDRALDQREDVATFLRQDDGETAPWPTTLARLRELAE